MPNVAGYDRSLFDHWIDEDHDCLNTRHELLMKLSTGTVDTGSNRCTVSREKGALGPLHWLPPDQGFHCQYILRFTRIVRTYGLVLSNGEHEAMQRLRHSKCG